MRIIGAIKTVTLALLVGVPGTAKAQDESSNGPGLRDRVKALSAPAAAEAPLPDTNAMEKGARPPASVSFQRAPSPPAPQAQAGAVDGFKSAGGVYGLDNGASDNSSGDAAAERPMTVPELHTVKKGDTLWSLCGYYFNDPWRWPQVWAKNPLITNPHWIFPGDTVRLRTGDESASPVAAAPASSDAPGIQTNKSFGSKAIVLRDTGFISAQELKQSGVITGSREEKIMLSTGDQAYVAFPKEKPLKAGERYSVFRADKDNPVRDPATGAVLGYLVKIQGELMLDQVADETSGRGTLVQLVDIVERGYGISARVQQFKRVEPRPSTVTLDARVVAAFTPVALLSADSFVVLSRGSRDGLEVGNRSYVIRRGDGYRGVMEHWETFDPRYPKEVVGELLVVDVQDNTSVAWIARSQKEIRIGEMTETRKGY